MKKLEELEVGDYVYHAIRGWKKMLHINGRYISIEGTMGSFHTSSGKFEPNNLNPTIYPYNPFDENDTPPQEFKKGEVIMVQDIEDDDNDWSTVKFDNFNGDYYIDSRETVWDRARKLNSIERGETT